MPNAGSKAARATAPQHTSAEHPGSVALLIGRYYFGTAGIASAVAIVILAFAPDNPAAMHGWLMGALAAYAAWCAWAFTATRERPGRMGPRLFLAGLGATAIIFFSALSFGDGIRHPTLGYAGLIVCMVSGVSSLRWGGALAVVCMAQIVLLGWMEATGRTIGPAAGTPLVQVVLHLGLLIAAGLASGALLARVLSHYLRAAAEREQRFRNLLHIAADWYWEQDEEFRFTHVSANSATGSLIEDIQRLGRRPWEMPGVGLSDAQLRVHREDLEAHRRFSGLVARRRDTQGQEHFLSISGEPKFGSDGRFCGYWGVGRDVTEEVRAQHAMAASESRYRELFQRSPSPLMLHRNGIVFDANDAAARMFGFESTREMQGFDLRQAYDEDSQRRVRERIARLESLPPGQGLPMDDFQLVSRTGRRLIVQASAARVETDDGPASLSLYVDITERVNAEAALRKSQALLSHVFDTSPDCITLTDLRTGHYELVNKAFERVTGFAAAEVIGRRASDIGIWHDPRERDRLAEAFSRHGRVTDMPAVIRGKDGRLVSMRLSAARFELDGQAYLVLNGRDVTAAERERMEHDAILQNASIGIAFTRDRSFQRTNPAFDRMFGWRPGELHGRSTTVIWPHLDDYDAMRADATPVLSRGMSYELERQMQRADGSLFWCRMRGQAIDGASPRGGTIWIAEDVTERRHVDQALAAARDAAEAASRAKSAFLANTSHEIRTPLNGLLGLARLAMQDGLDEERRKQYLAQIFDSAHNLSEIISDILDLSKIEAGKIALENVPFGLRDMLSSVHEAYQSLAEAKGLQLVLAIDGDVPPVVLGDPVRVRQILTNFVTNALKFTERGRVRIHAARGTQERVRLSVTDTGPGIDPSTQQRLFRPFSQADDSTTRRYGGTGLGLSICRELASLMDGDVGVASQLGRGSTFWAEIPLPPAELPVSGFGTLEVETDVLHGARVLLVEDNPVNMMIAVAILEQWRIEVEQAADGPSAIDMVDAAERDGRLFDVVLLDVQMPRMSGHEVARELRRRYDATTLPIIALTAAALVSERDQALASGMNAFLTKPIDAQTLKETIAQAILGKRDR